MKVLPTLKAFTRYAFALMVLPLLVFGSWRFWHRDPPLPDVAIMQAQRGDLLSAVTATGTIEARRTVDIKYDTQNPVTHLYVKEGDKVAVNQPVATMDLSLLEPALAQARETLQKDQANLVLAQASLHRAQALFEAQVLAQVDLDTARANNDALVHQTEAVHQAEEQIRRATLRSPIKGVVIALYVHEGELLGSATAVAGLGPDAAISKPTNTLMTIAEDGDLEVDADVNAVDMGRVLVNQAAKFTIDALQPQIFSGTVRSIALQPTVTNSVTTYRVVVAIPKREPRFRIGMPANVMLFRTVVKDALLVPPTAVRKEGGESLVFVARRDSEQATPEDGAMAEDQEPSAAITTRSVQYVAETFSATVIKTKIHPGDWVVLNAASVPSRARRMNWIETEFKPNPDPSDLQFERTIRPSNQTATTIPGPAAKGFLQQLFTH
jgi:HlyD family secretion protein